MKLRSIEIDFDVHKVIELNRRDFDETPNIVLRRLLGISNEQQTSEDQPSKRFRSWRKGRVELPHGTELRASYNGETETAKIVDGEWVNSDGSKHRAPSSALAAFARTKSGDSTSLNGKVYWEIRLPESDDWTLYKLYEQGIR